MPSSLAATVTSLEPWPSATSIRRPRAQRASAAERDSRPAPLAAKRPPRWRPIGSAASPWRSARPSVCAKSRAVTSTSAPRRSSARITGRMTSTCGELVRSTQTRIADGGGDLGGLLAREHRAHRDGEVRARRLLGAGQRAGRGVVAHRGLEVGRQPVVRLVADPTGLERRRQLVGPGVADDVEVPGGLAARAREVDQLAQARRLVVGGGAPAALGPAVEVRELDPQDRRLELVEPGVVADQLEGLLVARAVEAQHADGLGELVVARRDRPAVAERAEVLRREERERGGGAERAGPAGSVARTGRLR